MYKIIERIVAERTKAINDAILGEIDRIITDNGIITHVILNEKAIVSALKKSVPQKPTDKGWLYCPVCGKDVCVDHPRYCSDCGQALDWSDTE